MKISTVGVDGYPVSGARAGVGRYCADLLTTVAQRSALELDVLTYRLGSNAAPGSFEDLRLPGITLVRRPRVLTRASELFHRLGLPVRYDLLLPRRDVYFFTRYWRPSTGERPALTMVYDLSCIHSPETGKPRVVSRLLEDVSLTVSNSQAIGVISEAVAAEVLDAFPETEERIVLLRPAIGSVLRAAEGVSAPAALPPRYMLHVGTLEPRKNLVTLIKAAVGLPWSPGSASCPLVLAGRRGWMDEPILDAIVAAGDSVHWIPDPSDEVLADLYARAAVTLVSSRYEGFGLPVLEGMFFGSPVLCSDIPVFREVGGRVARYVDTSDVDTLAAAIGEQLEMTASERAELALEGRRHAQSFSWPATADAFAATVHSLAEHGGLPRDLAWVPPREGGADHPTA